jgi:hypothetical protein
MILGVRFTFWAVEWSNRNQIEFCFCKALGTSSKPLLPTSNHFEAVWVSILTPALEPYCSPTVRVLVCSSTENSKIELLRKGIKIPRGKLGYQKRADTIILTLHGTALPLDPLERGQMAFFGVLGQYTLITVPYNVKENRIDCF